MTLTIPTLSILSASHQDPDSTEPAPIVGILKRAAPTPYTEHKAATAYKAEMAVRKAHLKRLEAELYSTQAPSPALLTRYESGLNAFNTRKERFEASRPCNPVFQAPLSKCLHDAQASTIYITDPVLLLSLALSFDHLGSMAARDTLLALVTAMGPRRLKAALDKLNNTPLIKPSPAQMCIIVMYL